MERLPGFRDFYPEPIPHKELNSFEGRQYLFDHWRRTARIYGFTEYDGPPLEPVELYTTKSGQEILNQLYHFVDKGDREVALRPEMTPTLARLVAAHERHYKKPIKWFCIPQLFRYERQQRGRLREHFQWNADLIGEPSAAADAELLALLIDGLRALGLTDEDFVLRLSSREAWDHFLREREIPVSDHEAFYQIIDKLERVPAEETEKQLKPFGLSLAEIRMFIEASRPTDRLADIVENLQARGHGAFVQIDYRVIRGLAYYTGTVFEAFDRKGRFRAIAGGGRYDNLIRLISNHKVDLPAIGFGMGDVVLYELLKERGLLPDLKQTLHVFVLIEEEALRSDSLRLVQCLRGEGWRVDYPLTPAKPDKQFKRAIEEGAQATVKLEAGSDGTPQARLRNLNTRQTELVAPSEVNRSLRAAIPTP